MCLGKISFWMEINANGCLYENHFKRFLFYTIEGKKKIYTINIESLHSKEFIFLNFIYFDYKGLCVCVFFNGQIQQFNDLG